jgi:hypothetical protein
MRPPSAHSPDGDLWRAPPPNPTSKRENANAFNIIVVFGEGWEGVQNTGYNI